MRIHEHLNYLKSESSIQVNNFTNRPAIQQNLPLALQLLKYSREISPLQPFVHLRLAQVGSIVGESSEADISIERTVAVAPANPKFRKIAGVYYLQSSRPDLAAGQFQQYLKLIPYRFRSVMNIATGMANRFIEPISPDVIRDSMLPDDPLIMFQYATEYQTTDPEQQQQTLQRAANILDNLDFRSTDENKLLGDIRRLQGEKEKAIKAYGDYLLIIPHDEQYLYRQALLLEKIGKYEEAFEKANRLADRSATPKKYRDFAKKLRRLISERNESLP